ncbi:MAG: acyl-CoA dehydrogenase family protein, partial [Xanthobacteraceae bacterium]
MPSSPSSRPNVTAQDVIERARALAPRFGKRAEAAEEGRRIPDASVKDMLDAGFARILLPREIGGYGLDLETWHDVTRELSKA